MIISNYYKSKKARRKDGLQAFIEYAYVLKMKQKVAVIGALTALGRAVLDGLSEQGFVTENIYALDNRHNDGIQIPFQGGFLVVEKLDAFDFNQVRLAFLCTPSILSEYIDRVIGSRAYLIDCVGLYAEEHPCIIPSLNFSDCRNHRIILNPTSLTVTLAQVLSPIHKAFPIRAAWTTVLLSAGEFGGPAVQALVDQTRSLYTREQPVPGPFRQMQAFNLIPEVYPLLARQTTCQIKSLLHFPMTVATCLTPIFQGECYSLTLMTRGKCSLEQLERVFLKNDICRLVVEGQPDSVVTTQDVASTDYIYLSHLSVVPYQANTYHLWIVCDSFRNGAVANAVRIAEHLLS